MENFARQYDYIGDAGFIKPNMSKYAKPESKTWQTRLTGLFRNKSKN